ncbi:mariner Mos1 transposase [Trichonephila clavipes]|nr:mariner Mos1 transposase [Trichonephila clavipes]
MLLQRHERKSSLYGIVKWIYFDNPKWKKPWLPPDEAGSSTPRPNRFDKKSTLCVWLDKSGIAGLRWHKDSNPRHVNHELVPIITRLRSPHIRWMIRKKGYKPKHLKFTYCGEILFPQSGANGATYHTAGFRASSESSQTVQED